MPGMLYLLDIVGAAKLDVGIKEEPDDHVSKTVECK